MIEEELNRLYEVYKHSVPTKSYENKYKFSHKPYFKALEYDELSDEDFMYGANRQHAQFDLENRVFHLTDEEKKELFSNDNWFWQGDDKDFIIIKAWID